MGLYEQWSRLAQAEAPNEQKQSFWDGYLKAEEENYKKILENSAKVYSGKLIDLALEFKMEPHIFTGFLDGIKDSLKKPLKTEKLKEDSEIALDVDFEKLYFNMMEAKADWLYTLSEWEGVLNEEKRRAIAKEWRASKMAVSEKIERNAPCPCGSGLKYKKCCGSALNRKS